VVFFRTKKKKPDSKGRVQTTHLLGQQGRTTGNRSRTCKRKREERGGWQVAEDAMDLDDEEDPSPHKKTW
jgi:hypothetical protein